MESLSNTQKQWWAPSFAALLLPLSILTMFPMALVLTNNHDIHEKRGIGPCDSVLQTAAACCLAGGSLSLIFALLNGLTDRNSDLERMGKNREELLRKYHPTVMRLTNGKRRLQKVSTATKSIRLNPGEIFQELIFVPLGDTRVLSRNDLLKHCPHIRLQAADGPSG